MQMKMEILEKVQIDDILRTLDKFKNIRHKDENAYEILKKIYSECKKIVRFNKFSPEQCLKFYSLNDDIIFTALSNKAKKKKEFEIREKNELTRLEI